MNEHDVNEQFKELVASIDQQEMEDAITQGLSDDMDAELEQHLGADAFVPITFQSTGMEVSPADLYKMMAEASVNRLGWYVLAITPEEIREMVVMLLSEDSMPSGVYDSMRGNLERSPIWTGEVDEHFCEMIAATALQSIGLPPHFIETLNARAERSWQHIHKVSREANKYDGMDRAGTLRAILEGIKDEHPELYVEVKDLDFTDPDDLERAVEVVTRYMDETDWE